MRWTSAARGLPWRGSPQEFERHRGNLFGSDSLWLQHSAFAVEGAGVYRGGGLEQQDADLLRRDRLVLHAVRHDEEFSLIDGDLLVPQLHGELAGEDQEELVLLGVGVPYELALELDELDVAAG